MDFTCNSVEEHEVLKVGDLSPLPALSHVRRLEELTRGCQGNPPEMHKETHTHTHTHIQVYSLATNSFETHNCVGPAD